MTHFLRTIFQKSKKTERKGDDFLFLSKQLFLKDIHPFDFGAKELPEYDEILELGINQIKERGIQDFLNFLMESQYRISIWAAMIALEFGKPASGEILIINGKETIVDFCLDEIQSKEISDLSASITENKNQWIDKMKTRYNIV